VSEARYAIYAAPRRDEALWRFGSGLLGYDAAKPGDVAAPDLAGITRADWHSLTAEPRRYGFHTTLKAPFRLAGGQRESALQNALSDFCRRHQALPAFSLHVARLGPFFALIPKNANPGLQALAGDVVEAFDLFRAALSLEEMGRRNPAQLPARERGYLERWGYPYVFDAFRFHMTLTGRVGEEKREQVEAVLRDAYAALPPDPFFLAELVLFRQDTQGSRFVIVSRHAFTG